MVKLTECRNWLRSTRSLNVENARRQNTFLKSGLIAKGLRKQKKQRAQKMRFCLFCALCFFCFPRPSVEDVLLVAGVFSMSFSAQHSSRSLETHEESSDCCATPPASSHSSAPR